LHCYKDLIDAQIKSNLFEDALKTYKKIKFFNLNSSSPDDVWIDLESNGYKQYLPKSASRENLQHQRNLTEFQDPKEMSKKFEEFRLSRLRDNHAVPGNIYEQFSIVAKLCLMKSVSLKYVGKLSQCKIWMNIPVFVYQDLLEESGGTNDNIFCDLINTKLTLSAFDTSKRNNLFKELLTEFNKKTHNAVFYLHQLIQENMTDIETIMPFLQYLISQTAKGLADVCDKVYFQTHHHGELKTFRDLRNDPSPKDLSKKLLAYRNSLMVNNHFKQLKCGK